MQMYKYWIIIAALIISSCGVKEQAEQLKALENCSYEIVSADSVFIAGTEVSTLMANGGLNLLTAPQIAFSYLQQKMPVKGVVNLKITNSGTEEAAINQFEYLVKIKETELLKGFIDKKISVAPNGGSVIVPVKIDRDVYDLLSDSTNQKAVTQFLSSATEQNLIVTFKIKPSFVIGTETIKYPDYINIDKKLSNTSILSYFKSN